MRSRSNVCLLMNKKKKKKYFDGIELKYTTRLVRISKTYLIHIMFLRCTRTVLYSELWLSIEPSLLIAYFLGGLKQHLYRACIVLWLYMRVCTVWTCRHSFTQKPVVSLWSVCTIGVDIVNVVWCSSRLCKSSLIHLNTRRNLYRCHSIRRVCKQFMLAISNTMLQTVVNILLFVRMSMSNLCNT